jgi:phosphoenolpyruvate-protein kinase (PTS system EI component)
MIATVEQPGVAAAAEPGLAALAARTAELVEQAECIESWHADEQRDIVEAHRRGLTVTQWRDQLEAAIAYAESAEYAQEVWERQGEEYAAALGDGADQDDWEDDWENQSDAYTARLGGTTERAAEDPQREEEPPF